LTVLVAGVEKNKQEKGHGFDDMGRKLGSRGSIKASDQTQRKDQNGKGRGMRGKQVLRGQSGTPINDSGETAVLLGETEGARGSAGDWGKYVAPAKPL